MVLSSGAVRNVAIAVILILVIGIGALLLYRGNDNPLVRHTARKNNKSPFIACWHMGVAIMEYREKFSRLPEDLDDVVSAGLLSPEFLINPHTGEKRKNIRFGDRNMQGNYTYLRADRYDFPSGQTGTITVKDGCFLIVTYGDDDAQNDWTFIAEEISSHITDRFARSFGDIGTTGKYGENNRHSNSTLEEALLMNGYTLPIELQDPVSPTE